MSVPAGSVVARTYLIAVAAMGAVATAVSLLDIFHHPVHYSWYVFAFLTIVSGAAKLRLPAGPAHFSIADAFTTTGAVVFGPSAGTIMVAMETLAFSYRRSRRGDLTRQVLFNASVPPMALWLAAQAFFRTTGERPLIEHLVPVDRLLLPLAVVASLYYILNSVTIAIGVGLDEKTSPLTVWRTHFQGLWWGYFGGAAGAAAVTFLVSTHRPALTTVAVFLPLPLLLYFAFKNAIGRVDDQLKHLAEVNRLYLSTIESLAHAIDAKDQTTHGHIRRVQHYAVRLAEAMGLRDEIELKAIEAAGLLHDMGKLAIPEHILNKPGKLTAAEFEKMKLHATVGAEILSTIDFPYPVVPIVRHHHENWDGSGYPAGLKRLEIPVGARILSVVDCFDALTSDRPYRPRVTDQEAIEILLQRRGTMYDPLVVDTFVKVHRSIAPHEDLVTSTMPAARAVTKALAAVGAVPALPGPVDDTDVLRAGFDLGRALPKRAGLERIGRILWEHARQIMPEGTLVVFVYDAAADRLAPQFIAGHHANVLSEMHVQVGQKLTGWVAANRVPMLNADAALDLGDLRLTLKPRLRSCASVPLVAGNKLLGVVTYYASGRDPFTEMQGRFLLVVAERLPEICDLEIQPKTLSA